ncbi:hypothetical protein BH24GEM2_BH24GEM2_19820 [soil metagenome]
MLPTMPMMRILQRRAAAMLVCAVLAGCVRARAQSQRGLADVFQSGAAIMQFQ